MIHKFISVNDMFKKYKVINVPYYQRDYVWGTKNDGRNLYKFVDDIFSSFRDHPSEDYFIGTLAFCSERVNDVIDGQQRITSLILILSRLSELKCSADVKEANAKLLEPDSGQFVISEEFYLTEELKRYLGLPNTYNDHGPTANISKTIERIDNQILNAWSGNTVDWYDGLYNYILEKVKFISLEYNNISDSLKYFLNINSLSIQLTQAEIFFSILSQSIRISRSTYSIFTIKQKIKELGGFKGFDKDIDGYKAYDEKDEKGIDNIIYLFLNSYYQFDVNIQSLNDTGVGKWMSFYKNEVFNDPISALSFTNKFYQFLKDIEVIYKYFANMSISLDAKSSLYLTWVLIQYENFFDVLKVLSEVFRVRHNYIDGKPNLFKPGSNDIDICELNEIGKRINLTFLWNYIRSNTKRTTGLIENITLDTSGNYKESISNILGNIDYDKIFNLTYRRDPQSNIKIEDNSHIIKLILACQESFLDSIADPSKDMGEYLNDLLTVNKFTVEHIYSVNEWKDSGRLNNWRTKKGKFNSPDEFDLARFDFQNLSLLNASDNSSASDLEIHSKMAKYKLARRIFGSKWEYLIQSLVDDSEYYKDSNIQALGLPERKLINIDQNTWELSLNNREFNIKLLKKALEAIASK